MFNQTPGNIMRQIERYTLLMKEPQPIGFYQTVADEVLNQWPLHMSAEPELIHFAGPNGPLFTALAECETEQLRLKLESPDRPPIFSGCATVPSPESLTPLLLVPPLHYFLYRLLTSVTRLSKLTDWETRSRTLYSDILDSYLRYFLPESNDKGVLAISTTANSHHHHSLLDNSMHRSHLARLEERGVQRCQIFLALLVDCWLRPSNPAQPELPSPHHIIIVRHFIKRLHMFSQDAPDHPTSVSDTLRTTVLPDMLQAPLFDFLKFCLAKWPLDPSYMLVVETWLTFIQPWRYIGCQMVQTTLNETEVEPASVTPVASVWRRFILENAMFYSELLSFWLGHLLRANVSSPPYARIALRVTKVFTQPSLLEYISEADSAFLAVESQSQSFVAGSQDANAHRRQCQMLRSTHVPPFTIQHDKLIQLAQNISAALQRLTRNEKGPSGFFSRLLAFETDSSTTVNAEETKRLLNTARGNICQMACIPLSDLPQAISTSAPSSTPTGDATMQENMTSRAAGEYRGDPDLQRPRTYENTFLLRLTLYFSILLTHRFHTILKQLCSSPGFKGHVAREAFQPHPDYPPRVRLRAFASYRFLAFQAIAAFMWHLISGYSVVTFPIFCVSSWALHLSFRSYRSWNRKKNV